MLAWIQSFFPYNKRWFILHNVTPCWKYIYFLAHDNNLLCRCAEHLVTSGALVNMAQRESGLTPLHVACRRGLEDHVELFLSYGGDVTARSQEGETPLNAACAGAERPADAGRYLRIVQKLLAARADAQTAGRKKHTALHNACGNCCPRIVKLLLEHGARADVANCAEYTPLDCLLQVGWWWDRAGILKSGSRDALSCRV